VAPPGPVETPDGGSLRKTQVQVNAAAILAREEEEFVTAFASLLAGVINETRVR